MNGEELIRGLSQDPILQRKADLVRVLSLIELPQEPLAPWTSIALIVNTEPDPRSMEGQHWVAFYGDPKESPHLEYFDSYGLYPFRERILRFLGTQKKPWLWNSTPLQRSSDSYCGYYCLYYLLKRCRGDTMEEIVGRLAQNDPHHRDVAVRECILRTLKTMPVIP